MHATSINIIEMCIRDRMSDTEFIENHYKIVSNKNRVYVRVAATVTAESKSYRCV